MKAPVITSQGSFGDKEEIDEVAAAVSGLSVEDKEKPHGAPHVHWSDLDAAAAAAAAVQAEADAGAVPAPEVKVAAVVA
jgi:PPE-repeat protein